MVMIRNILERLAKGRITVREAESLLKPTMIKEVEHIARLDIGREIRTGIPEIILAEGKTPDDVVRITSKLLQERKRVVISRCSKNHIRGIKKEFQDAKITVNDKARMVIVKSKEYQPLIQEGRVGLITAGTSDIPVAEEARLIAEEAGCKVFTAYDVGIAGLHRVFPPLDMMMKEGVDVIIAVAGMEGALPSIIAGLVDIPVIGVPTSSGYGIGGKGIGALISMLQSCSLGLAVVNIDNGIAAGVMAALITRNIERIHRD
ncbi:MAG: nickel pincer cofactor biosynthesis protein LarB [Candidatus Hodarchaeota archaeon]